MKALHPHDEVLDAVFDIFVDAAVKGERCPTQDGVAYALEKRGFVHRGGGIASELADLGRIRIEIYSLNWRVVEICEGEHKGKRTKACPRGGKPYVVIDGGGRRVVR